MFAYDNIGNRDTYTKGTGAQTTYETNNLNQYENVETASSPVTGQNMVYDADGNVTESYVVGDFDGDGSVGFSDLAIFSSSYGYCEGDPEFDERANLVTGDNPECIDVSDQSAFMSLFGLSATSVMRAQMQWDAENRLAAYIPLNPSGGAKKVTFKYDYRGRRIEKNVYAWSSGGSAWHTNWTERRRFVWNGWLMLRETIESDLNSDGDLNDQDEGTRVKTYTWGKDLGGGLESAGGIGGLLAVYDDSATSGSTGDDLAYVYMYDANGNVGQVCNLSQSTASASIVAKYEYDAYGNATVASGSYATATTYRFSTKPWDDETGLGYWGYRYYDPRLGRWMSRDPIGEIGGEAIYALNWNRPVARVDALGQWSMVPSWLWDLVQTAGVLYRVCNPLKPDADPRLRGVPACNPAMVKLHCNGDPDRWGFMNCNPTHGWKWPPQSNSTEACIGICHDSIKRGAPHSYDLVIDCVYEHEVNHRADCSQKNAGGRGNGHCHTGAITFDCFARQLRKCTTCECLSEFYQWLLEQGDWCDDGMRADCRKRCDDALQRAFAAAHSLIEKLCPNGMVPVQSPGKLD